LTLVVLIALTTVAVASVPVWFRTIALRTNARLALASLLLLIVTLVLVPLASTLITLVSLSLVALVSALIILILVALASALIALITLATTLVTLVLLTPTLGALPLAAILSTLARTPLAAALVALGLVPLVGALGLGLLASALGALSALTFSRPFIFRLSVFAALRRRDRPLDGRPVVCMGCSRECDFGAGSQRNKCGKNHRTDLLVQGPAMS
jgi:hypothetical protein